MRTLLIVLGLLCTIPSYTCDQHGFTGIVEENQMWIPEWGPEANGFTEKMFNDTLDRIEAIYSPIIEDMGARLVVERKWADGTVNAYAQQQGRTWRISMFGGLARHFAVSQDAFALVACHEIGHHIGGAPKRTMFWFPTWASNEGQSDYFGTMKCLRKYFEYDDNIQIISEVPVDNYITEACSYNFSDPVDLAICQRSALAGMSLAELFRDLRKLEEPLDYATPDQSVVKSTDHSHPDPQCRLDTYFQAALCYRHHSEDVSNTDAAAGVCAREMGDQLGLRPLCWYKP